MDAEEWDNLRFQIGTSRWGGCRYAPYAFTEHGRLTDSAFSEMVLPIWFSCLCGVCSRLV